MPNLKYSKLKYFNYKVTVNYNIYRKKYKYEIYNTVK